MSQRNRYLIYVVLLGSVILSNYGCVGSLGRGTMLGEKYSDIIGSLPAIPDGKGRVFVYMVDGGPTASDNGTGWSGPISIDGKIYKINGETFAYYDLEQGCHEISAGGISLPAKEFMGGWNFRPEGIRQVKFVISDKEIKYIRIDIRPSPSFKKDAAWSEESTSGDRFYPTLLESDYGVKNAISSLRIDPYAVKPMPDKLIVQ